MEYRMCRKTSNLIATMRRFLDEHSKQPTYNGFIVGKSARLIDSLINQAKDMNSSKPSRGGE